MSEQSQNIKPKNRLQHLLAKIAGNDTAKVVKPKMKNEFYLSDISENGSGGGGGANVLTLYLGEKEVSEQESIWWCYKNPEHTEEYESYEEAEVAVKNAGIIEIIQDSVGGEEVFYPISKLTVNGDFGERVSVNIIHPNAEMAILYYKQGSPQPGPK